MVVIEALLSKEEVSQFRHGLQNCTWQDGGETAMGMAAEVKRNLQTDAQCPQVQQLTNQLLARMGNCPKLVSAALPQHIFPPCFNRYEQAQEYGFHVDAAIMRLPGTQSVMRSDLSMTIFLSEPEEYQGGELLIQTDYGEQRVKLNAGSAVLYPSSSLHRVTPVTQGQRLAAITWMQSMVTDAQIRESLFELDQTIQSLISSNQCERQHLDRLHNVYHNLVRKHAVV
jgi:PKHD-type hydroxylase